MYTARPSPLALDSENGVRTPKETGGATEYPSLEYQLGTRTPPVQTADSQHVQFASYREEKPSEWKGERDAADQTHKSWTPLPLRLWFWSCYAIILIGGAIALEVALEYNKKDNGWAASSGFSSQSGVLHYVYTFPSVVIGMITTSVWTWADVEIKKMQPYVSLAHGDAPPRTTLLLDYTRTNNFLVWTHAARNKHYIVTLSTLMVILSLCFSPLSASLFAVQDVLFHQPPLTINSLSKISLNQGPSYQDLTAFLTAAGYASASVLYGLGPPSWILNGYTITQLDIPDSLVQNGTLEVNTTAIYSNPNCTTPDNNSRPNMNHLPDGNWLNSATYQDCNFTWFIDHRAKDLFGQVALGLGNETTTTSVTNATGPGCAAIAAMPQEQQPLAMWFFTYESTPANSSIAFCNPSIEFWRVKATVDLTTRNLTKVDPIAPLQSGDPGFELSGSMTGAPLNGKAYNGAAFNTSLSSADPFVVARAGSTVLQLPAAVMQAARDSPVGLVGTFVTDGFVPLSTRVLQMYLQVFAQTVYFVEAKDTLAADINARRPRVILSPTSVHLLATALLILAFFGSIVQILHRGDRRDLRLGHAPGTIASAVALGGQTDVGAVLAGRQLEDDIVSALADKRFRMDVRTGKIVMEGERGYDDAGTPDPRRGSMFGMIQRGLQPAPMSPRTPGRTPPRSPLSQGHA